MDVFPKGDFDDVLSGNEAFAERFTDQHLSGVAKEGLAIITCMDSRIDPLAIVGMKSGDVKILRNAGARVTDDVLRTLVLASHLLGVRRVLVLPHTKCRMASATEDQIHDLLSASAGMDTRSLEIRTVEDQFAALARDVRRIRAYPYLPKDLKVAGAIYEVESGRLRPADV
jgi:carbonic anhydrase